jgi:hypothetical protein
VGGSPVRRRWPGPRGGRREAGRIRSGRARVGWCGDAGEAPLGVVQLAPGAVEQIRFLVFVQDDEENGAADTLDVVGATRVSRGSARGGCGGARFPDDDSDRGEGEGDGGNSRSGPLRAEARTGGGGEGDKQCEDRQIALAAGESVELRCRGALRVRLCGGLGENRVPALM